MFCAGKSFSSAKSNELTKQQVMFCFNHAFASIRTTPSWLLMNNKFKTQAPTGNPTGNSRYHVLASCASNMSCSFGQSAIETRCVVIFVSWWRVRCTSSVSMTDRKRPNGIMTQKRFPHYWSFERESIGPHNWRWCETIRRWWNATVMAM